MNTKPKILTRRVHFVGKPEDVKRWEAAAGGEDPPLDLSAWIRRALNDKAAASVDAVDH